MSASSAEDARPMSRPSACRANRWGGVMPKASGPPARTIKTLRAVMLDAFFSVLTVGNPIGHP